MISKAIKLALIVFAIWYVVHNPDRAGRTGHELLNRAASVLTTTADAAASFLDHLVTAK